MSILERAYEDGRSAYKMGLGSVAPSEHTTVMRAYSFKAGWESERKKQKPGIETPQEYRRRFCDRYPIDDCDPFLWTECFKKYRSKRAGSIPEFKVDPSDLLRYDLKQQRECDKLNRELGIVGVWSRVVPPRAFKLPPKWTLDIIASYYTADKRFTLDSTSRVIQTTPRSVDWFIDDVEESHTSSFSSMRRGGISYDKHAEFTFEKMLWLYLSKNEPFAKHNDSADILVSPQAYKRVRVDELTEEHVLAAHCERDADRLDALMRTSEWPSSINREEAVYALYPWKPDRYTGYTRQNTSYTFCPKAARAAELLR